jgi:hypothetical protein
LNEPGPAPGTTLALKKVFVLRADPQAGKRELQGRTTLDQDSLALLAEIGGAGRN